MGIQYPTDGFRLFAEVFGKSRVAKVVEQPKPTNRPVFNTQSGFDRSRAVAMSRTFVLTSKALHLQPCKLKHDALRGAYHS